MPFLENSNNFCHNDEQREKRRNFFCVHFFNVAVEISNIFKATWSFDLLLNEENEVNQLVVGGIKMYEKKRETKSVNELALKKLDFNLTHGLLPSSVIEWFLLPEAYNITWIKTTVDSCRTFLVGIAVN